MRAMVLVEPRKPLREVWRDDPEPRYGELLLRVKACGVCRTDLHIADGELEHPKPLVVPGHEVVGEVLATGPGTSRFRSGDLVGVPWLGRTCRTCLYCVRGQENLCDAAEFTGYTLDGGYADVTVALEDYCVAIPGAYTDVEAAPLLCAGLIGYRSLKMTGEADRVGVYGFGAAAHIVAQVARFQGRHVYAFTRRGDRRTQEFARQIGVTWTGDSPALPPDPLDAAIIFAPAGELVPQALRAVRKGGTVVCGGIHMSDIPQFPYRLLWGERVLRSVANLTRSDGEEFLAVAPQVPIRPKVHTYPLEKANEALSDLRAGSFHGAAVLVP